ncbi:MAG TPA: STAS domain-containing protein [Solirubrobacterales bacterium]
MGVARDQGMARGGERVERSSGAAPPPQSGGSGQATALRVHIEDSAEGPAVVSFSGELDLSGVARMEGALLEQIRQRPAVLVDLSALDFIDSSGIGALIQARRAANGTPVSFLVGAGSQVERVFGIAGVGEALPLFSDRQAAMAAMAASRSG